LAWLSSAKADDPDLQLALFTTWCYHAFVTDRPGQTLELEADH